MNLIIPFALIIINNSNKRIYLKAIAPMGEECLAKEIIYIEDYGIVEFVNYIANIII